MLITPTNTTERNEDHLLDQPIELSEHSISLSSATASTNETSSSSSTSASSTSTTSASTSLLTIEKSQVVSEKRANSKRSTTTNNTNNIPTTTRHLVSREASQQEAIVPLWQRGIMENREDTHNYHNGEQQQPNLGDVEEATSTAKRYRNSPFGLTRHYLTMPDEGNKIFSQNYTLSSKGIAGIGGVGSGIETGKYTPNTNLEEEEEEESDEDSDPREPHSKRSKTRWNKSKNKSISSHRDQNSYQHDLNDVAINTHHANQCDSSVEGSTSASSKERWFKNEYKHHNRKQQQQQQQQPHMSQPSAHRPLDPMDLTNHCTPAGDAGLDAPRCNAKEMENGDGGFYNHHNHQHHHHHHINHQDLRAKGLKMDELIQEPEECNSLLVRFSSIMYATFLVILGCILHVAELRQKSKNSTDHIYTTIVALIGILWLLFLQADLQRYKRYASKYILIETIFNDHHAQQNLDEARRRKMLNQFAPTARSITSSSASLVNDRLSMNTEVIFKKTAYKMYQQRAALGRQNNHHKQRMRTGSKLSHSSSQDEPFDMYNKSSTSGASNGSGKSSLPHLAGNMDSGAMADNLVPAYKFLHGKMGANFYLKCGMAAFCFGHVIHEGLRFGQQVYFFGAGNVHCRDFAALVAHLVTPLYSFYQLFMMFKYSNLVINRHKVLARFGLMHIIGTSVTFWFRTILEEAFEDFVHKMDYFKTNKPHINLALTNQIQGESSNLVSLITALTSTMKPESGERSDWSFTAPTSDQQQNSSVTQSLIALMSSPISATITPQIVRHLPDSYACAQNTLLTTKSMNALPYLYPFTIEYNLLLAATFLSLYFNIGKIGHLGNCRPPFMNYPNMLQKARSLSSGPGSNVESSDNSTATRMQEGWHKDMGEYKSNFVVNADCHSANKGLFCGFFVLLVTLVTIVIFFVTINKPTHIQLGIKINLIQEATLTALILIVTLAGFKQIVKLNRNPYLKDKVTTDDVLMLIPLPFFFIHSLLSFRAETASMSSGSGGLPFSSILQKSVPSDTMATPSGNLQSLLLRTSSNNTQLDSRSRLNNLLAGHPNGTNGRFVEEFISNSNNNRNGRNISSLDAGSSNSSQIDHFKLITVALNIIVMIEVLVQTNFIIDGMRRCSESRYLRFKKPGRELITFAILLNITYWIVATFETKSVEQYKTEIEYYGPLPYMFISHTTLPVMLFYRYHSSVCLAEIWNRAYKPPKKR